MSDLHNFNAGRKSWKMYAKELTSKDGDDLTITPYAGEDLILEVSGNGNILFKEDGITYNLADLSNNASSSSNVNLTNYDDASFNNVDISGSLLINGINSRMPAEVENSLRKYLPLNHGQTDTTNTQTFMDIANDLSSNLLTSNKDAYFNNVNITTKLTGPSTFVIDPAAVGDNTGLLVIKGGLQIDGSSTIINSSIVDISDHQLLLAANAPNLSATDGAGIDVSGGASFKYKYSSGAFNDGHWESNIDLSCETINTQNINNASKIVLTAPLVEIENTGTLNTHFNSSGSNYINGLTNWISSFDYGLHLDTYGTGTDSGVRIKNRGFIASDTDTAFNYMNTGENYIRGSVNYINSFTNGIFLDASGSGTNSGVQIVNGSGLNSTIFNYQNNGSNFIHGTSRFFNDIHIQKIIDASNSTGNFGAVLMSEGTGTNKWSNNPSLPNYLYMGSSTNVGLSGQVLVSQHTGGFPTWADLPVINSKVNGAMYLSTTSSIQSPNVFHSIRSGNKSWVDLFTPTPHNIFTNNNSPLPSDALVRFPRAGTYCIQGSVLLTLLNAASYVRALMEISTNNGLNYTYYKSWQESDSTTEMHKIFININTLLNVTNTTTLVRISTNSNPSSVRLDGDSNGDPNQTKPTAFQVFNVD
jgi:hypothetical protein